MTKTKMMVILLLQKFKVAMIQLAMVDNVIFPPSSNKYVPTTVHLHYVQQHVFDFIHFQVTTKRINNNR